MPNPKNPNAMTYMWENVPRDLIEKAKKKLALQEPPGTLKWLLIDLLREYVEPRPKRGRSAKHR